MRPERGRRATAASPSCDCLGDYGIGGHCCLDWVGWVWSSIGLIWVPAVSFLCAFAILVLLGIRGARVLKAKASLPRVDADCGRVVEIHVVASEEPGEGRRLLDGIVAEADSKGQTA